MKKLLIFALSTMMLLSFAACATQAISPTISTNPTQSTDTANTQEAIKELPTSITITTLNANKEAVQLEVPYNPQRIAVIDLASLDILDKLGMGDRVVGVSKGSSIDYLQSYIANDVITNLGTIKEADLEAVMKSQPDVIFIGSRLAPQYDALSKIAPVIYLSTDVNIGVVKSVSNNATTISSLFGLEEKVSNLLSDFDSRIQGLSDFAKGKNAIVGIVTSGSFNVLGNDGRCSIIGVEVGFENLGNGDVTATHGNESSFELIVSKNPEYVFVMDRDAAIGTDGAKLAQEIIENELVMKTDAYKNGNIIYLANPEVWYTAEGGITAMDIMISDLETALIK